MSVVAALPGARANLGASEVLAEDLREFTTTRVIDPRDKWQRLLTEAGSHRPRNVIVIVLESVGAEYLSLYGNKLNTTSRLLAEQENALVFDRYYAPVAWTAYSLMALVLSQRPPMEPYNEASFRTRDLEAQSLPEVLKRSGYRTAFMTAGKPDWAGGNFLEDSGFEETFHAEDLRGAKKVSSWGTEDRFLFRSMLDWIDTRGNQPFFLMAWTDQTHNPYKLGSDPTLVRVLPSNSPRKDDLHRYLSLVRGADSRIGMLLDALRRRGLADSTLVVITGDHGEAFGGVHGGSGHGFTVYDEEVRVPLILWNPVIFHGGARPDVVGSHPDLAPTVLNVLGIKPPAGWHGRSLLDSGKPQRAYFFAAAWGEYLLGVRDGNLKYIYDARDGRQELYDLAADPDEHRNLASADAEHAGRLRQRLAAWLQIQRGPASAETR